MIEAMRAARPARVAVLLALVLALVAGAMVSSGTALAQANPGTVEAGGQTVVTLDHSGALKYQIDPATKIKATFTRNNGTEITCADNTACDENGTSSGVALRVQIAADSPLGTFYVQSVGRAAGADAVVGEHPVEVIAANPATTIQVLNNGPVPKTVPQNGSAGAVITVRLVKADGTGFSGQTLEVRTSLGDIHTDGQGGCGSSSGTTDAGKSSCEIDTAVDDAGTTGVNEAGRATVSVHGDGTPGTAQVTFTLDNSTLTRTVKVPIYGAAASMTVAAQNSAIEIGGDTFLVATILDSGGNPVAGEQVDVNSAATNGGITSPKTPVGVLQVKVLVDNDKDFFQLDPDDADKDLPACGNQPAGVNPRDTSVSDYDKFTAGTNADGKCVIKVSAPGDTTPNDASDDATRGAHMITVKAGSLDNVEDLVTLTINVGGPPASITSDAPASVDPLSSITITYTVLDDRGVPVGVVDATLDQIEGSGKVTAGEDKGDTADGQRSFTYRAPLTPGAAVFLVSVPVGDSEVTHEIVVQIGDSEAPEPPAAPSNVSLSVVDGALTVAVSPDAPEGATLEIQVQHNSGAWMAWPEMAPSDPGNYNVRARFVADGLASAWTYSSAGGVTIVMPEPEPEPEPVISLDLRAGGRIVAVTASGPQTTAAALFGDAVTSAWKYNQDTGVWDVVYIPGRSGNFSIATGDILFVSSPIDQTVGG